MASPAPATIIRLSEVMRRTGRSRAGIYALMAEGKFPKTIKLGVRAVGWVESEVDDHITRQIEAHRSSQRGAA